MSLGSASGSCLTTWRSSGSHHRTSPPGTSSATAALTDIEHNGDRVTLVVEVPYVRRRFAILGCAFRIEVLDCSHLEFTPYEGAALSSPSEIVQAYADVVEAKNEGHDVVVVWGSSGSLRVHYQALALRFDDGTPLALAALDECSRAYWDEWNRDARQPTLGTASPQVLLIDGKHFDDLEGFWYEVSRQLIPGADWGHNLDAFNDVLRGGFGTPEGGFVLRWLNSDRSREVLGYGETVHWLERTVSRCHQDNVPAVHADLAAARNGEGPTLFDIIVEIVRAHGPGGDEAEDGIELRLE